MTKDRIEYLTSQGVSKTIEERFWDKVNRHGPIPELCPELDPCWIWTACTARGYGFIKRGAEFYGMILAHRLSWILHVGPIPEKLWCLHKCDTPACVNPSHLWLGTDKDNMMDCSKKNRTTFGEKSGTAKLSQDEVNLIRSTYSIGQISMKRLSELFGVCPMQVCRIIHGTRWQKSLSHAAL